MATIENKTLEAIKRNGKLLLSISKERIWEEFKKSFTQAKDFNSYLKLLSDLNLYEYIFPGANINTDLVDSKDFVVIIANLFKNEYLSGLERKLVQEYKIELETATKATFLISFLDFKVEDVFSFYKKRNQCAITDQTILEWLKVQGINDDTLIKFIHYRPSVSSKDLMDKGITGKNLGIKINELEIELFKKYI